MLHQANPNHYRKLEDFRVQHRVHSLVVDLKTDRAYKKRTEKAVRRMIVYEGSLIYKAAVRRYRPVVVSAGEE